MKKVLFSVAALTVLFAACSKDDDTNNGGRKYLDYRVSEKDSFALTYDDANRVSSFAYTVEVPANTMRIYKLVYSNGVLTSVLAGTTASTPVKAQGYDYYPDGKLKKVSFYEEDAVHIDFYDSLQYDANGRVAGYYVVNYNDAEIRAKVNFIWDTKGNVSTQEHIMYNDGVPETDTTFTRYTYDNKINIASMQPELYLSDPSDHSALCANNVLTAVLTSKNSVTNLTNDYTYDEEGYPATMHTKVVITQNGQQTNTDEQTHRFHYFKK